MCLPGKEKGGPLNFSENKMKNTPALPTLPQLKTYLTLPVSELIDQTISIVMRISFLIKTIKPYNLIVCTKMVFHQNS